jgi:hypothetical protein
MTNDFKTLLHRSFDEPLTANEQILLDHELERNPDLQSEKKSIESLRKLIGKYKPGFKDDFAEKVLERLSFGRLIVAPNQVWMVFKRAGLMAAAAIIILLVMVYWQDQSFRLNSLLGLSELHPEDFDNLFANY